MHNMMQAKQLTEEECKSLEMQNSRMVSEHRAKMLELDAGKHWDLFYKRNETRFFKDRHWTTREFTDLLNENYNNIQKTILEIGCGVGNFIFPILVENSNFYVIACDISARAIQFVKSHKFYDERYLNAFQTDITTEHIHSVLSPASVDIVTLIFVLSAIHPDKYEGTLSNIFKLLKPGGVVLFRDYGLYDMAQLRFKAGHKISENFYMRQDGTRSYYFSVEFLTSIFLKVGFEVVTCRYVHRRTINKKENIDVPRIFLQAKFRRSDN